MTLSNGISLTLLLCALVARPVFSQRSESAAAAFRLAKASGKPVLIVFSGSDWCAPCMRFNKNVLSQPAFNDFAKDNLILFNADFPQRRKLPEEVKRSNDSLAEVYNPRGEFPHVVLIMPDLSSIRTIPYLNQKEDEFIAELRRLKSSMK